MMKISWTLFRELTVSDGKCFFQTSVESEAAKAGRQNINKYKQTRKCFSISTTLYTQIKRIKVNDRLNSIGICRWDQQTNMWRFCVNYESSLPRKGGNDICINECFRLYTCSTLVVQLAIYLIFSRYTLPCLTIFITAIYPQFSYFNLFIDLATKMEQKCISLRSFAEFCRQFTKSILYQSIVFSPLFPSPFNDIGTA